MKKIITLAILISILLSGCKYFKNKMLFSKGADTLLNYAEEISEDTSQFYSGLGDVKTESDISSDSLNNLYQQNVSLGSKKVHMIVGSFLIPQNADRYAEKISAMGYSTEIVMGYNGFHMVSAKSYDNLREGVQDIPAFRADITEHAWVYLKK